MERLAWVSRERSSPIYLICPSCGGRMKIPHGQARQKCRCARCHAVVLASASPPQPAPQAGNGDDGIWLSEPVERSPIVYVSPENLGEPDTDAALLAVTLVAVLPPVRRIGPARFRTDTMARQRRVLPHRVKLCGGCSRDDDLFSAARQARPAFITVAAVPTRIIHASRNGQLETVPERRSPRSGSNTHAAFGHGDAVPVATWATLFRPARS